MSENRPDWLRIGCLIRLPGGDARRVIGIRQGRGGWQVMPRQPAHWFELRFCRYVGPPSQAYQAAAELDLNLHVGEGLPRDTQAVDGP
jgi:hypothetical protein